MPSPERTTRKGQKRCAYVLPSGSVCALQFGETDTHEICPQHRTCSESAHCLVCAEWSVEDWLAFNTRRTYKEKMESRARSESSTASIVAPSRQPSNQAVGSNPSHGSASKGSNLERHSQGSSAVSSPKKKKKKKRKKTKHRSARGSHHQSSGHGTESGHSTPDTFREFRPDPDLVLEPDTSLTLGPGHPDSRTSGHPTPDSRPDPDDPDTVYPVVVDHVAPTQSTSKAYSPTKPTASSSATRKETRGQLVHDAPTQPCKSTRGRQAEVNPDRHNVEYLPSSNREKHSPRVITHSAPPAVPVPIAPVPIVSTEQLQAVLLSLNQVFAATPAPSTRTDEWVGASPPPPTRKKRRRSPSSSSSSSSASSSSRSRTRGDRRTRRRSRSHSRRRRSRSRSYRRDRRTRSRSKSRGRSPRRKARSDTRRTPSPFCSRDRDRSPRKDLRPFGPRAPTSQLSPRAAYRQSEKDKGYYRPDHDRDKTFYDKDIKQRDSARAHEAEAKARDREAREQRSAQAKLSAASTSRRSHSRSRSHSDSRERRSPHSSDSDSRLSEAYQNEGVESQEEVDSPAHDGGTHSFKERLTLVRNTFALHPSIVDNPAETIARKSCLGVGSDDAHVRTVSSLPWHPLRSKLVSDDMAKLLGKAPSKGRKAATFGPGRFLSRPSQRRSAYRITGDPPLSAAPVPPDFHLLQPKGATTEHVAVRLSAAEAEDMESSLRQSTAVASHQDWFLGAAREILEAVNPDDTDKTKTQVDQAISLLKSGAHAGMDLQSSQHTSLHNFILRRRDAFLNTTVKEFTPVARRALRQHSLDSPALFENSACTQASKQILKAGTLSKVTSGSNRPPPAAAAPKARAQQQQPKAKPWSAPKPPYQPPQQQKTSPPKRGKPSPRSSFKGSGGGNRGGRR